MKIKDQNNSKIKNFLLYIFLFSWIVTSNVVSASGAYDKGTAAGKGNLEFNITINPLNLISYGQNYGILSFGIHDRVDLVSYYSTHKSGMHSYYVGGFYQFLKNKKQDLVESINIQS